MNTRTVRRLAGIVLAATLVAAACSSDSDDESGDSVVQAEGGSDSDGAGGGAGDGSDSVDATVTLTGLSGLTAEAVVTSGRPIVVDITATAGDHVVTVPRRAVAATEQSIPVVGMRADRDYSIEIVAVGEDGSTVGDPISATVTTEPLPEWMPAHQITYTEGATSPGFTLVETSPPFAGPPDAERPEGWPDQVVIAYDDEAEIVWWYSNTGSIGGVEQTDRGTFLNHYWPFGIRETDVYGVLTGHWRPQPADTEGDEVDDDALTESVDPDQVENFPDALDGNPGDIEPLAVRADWVDLNGVHHENWPMPNGNILTLSTTVHELTPEQRAAFCPDDPTDFDVISDVVVEYQPDGTVVRTWDLWDVIDVDEHPGLAMCVDEGLFSEVTLRDWTHSNSVVYDPQRDAVVISSRHTDQIIALNHLDDEGPQTDLRWIIGAGGTMPLDGEPTYHQHAVEFQDDGTMVVYDNGNTRPTTDPQDPANPPYSRAVIYEVDDTSDDPSDWSARQLWEHIAFDDEGERVYAAFIGDADVLDNGNVLITHGGIGTFPPVPEDPLRALIIEVVPDGASGGETVWEFRSDPSAPNTSYRAERITSFYVGDEWATA